MLLSCLCLSTILALWEAYRPECMTAECVSKASVMIWGCITWYGVGTLCQVNGNIKKLVLEWIDTSSEHIQQ
jgi:hypothetical protein